MPYYTTAKIVIMRTYMSWLGKRSTIHCPKKDKLMNNESSQFLSIKGERTVCLVTHAHTCVEQFFLGLKGVGGRFDILILFSFNKILFNSQSKSQGEV